jgi:hypothetical protein
VVSPLGGSPSPKPTKPRALGEHGVLAQVLPVRSRDNEPGRMRRCGSFGLRRRVDRSTDNVRAGPSGEATLLPAFELGFVVAMDASRSSLASTRAPIFGVTFGLEVDETGPEILP